MVLEAVLLDSVHLLQLLTFALAAFTMDSYTSALSIAVPLLALMGALSLTVEIGFAFVRYD